LGRSDEVLRPSGAVVGWESEAKGQYWRVIDKTPTITGEIRRGTGRPRAKSQLDLDLPAKARVIEGTVQPCDVANFGPVMHRWEPEV